MGSMTDATHPSPHRDAAPPSTSPLAVGLLLGALTLLGAVSLPAQDSPGFEPDDLPAAAETETTDPETTGNEVSREPTGPTIPFELAVTEDNAPPGSLLLETDRHGLYLPAPQLDTEIHLRVTGIVARALVTQRFHNPTDYWVEGVYLFPLPERSAVDHLLMKIGDRTIEGQIHERIEAEKIYQEAKSSGRRASLVRQERPNVFRTAVANIGPRQTIEIELEMQQVVDYDSGTFRLRFPTVVAPRFHGSPSPELLLAGVEEEPITPWAECGIDGDGGANLVELAAFDPVNLSPAPATARPARHPWARASGSPSTSTPASRSSTWRAVTTRSTGCCWRRTGTGSRSPATPRCPRTATSS